MLLCFNEVRSFTLHLFTLNFSVAIQVSFKEKLKDQTVEEGSNLTLRCELSKAGVPVEWKKGGELIEAGERFQMRLRQATAELFVFDAVPEDSGVYSCVYADQKTKATIKVTGTGRANHKPFH